MNHAVVLADFHQALARLEPEPEHTVHVARIAVRLFDQLQPIHQLHLDDRSLLEGAALLHDIGWPASDGGTAHHKHSARIIRQQHWPHLSSSQVECVAQVARYHRKSLPSTQHPEFKALPTPDQLRVRHLAALLRLADAFDRSHLQRILDVEVHLNGASIAFLLHAHASHPSASREIAAAEKKGDLAREIYQRNLAFTCRPAASPNHPDLRPPLVNLKNRRQ